MSRDERKDKDKKEKHRDRDDSRERTNDRDRSRERRDKSDRDKERDREKDRDREDKREKKDRHRDDSERREKRDKSDRDRKDKEGGSDDRERKDKDKKEKHRDRDDSRERTNDRDHSRERRDKSDRDKDRDREDKREKKDRHRDDSERREKKEKSDRSDRDRKDKESSHRDKTEKHRDRDSDAAVSSTTTPAAGNSRSTTPPPATVALGFGGVQPSGTFGGNMFNLGSNSNTTMTGNNNGAMGFAAQMQQNPKTADSLIRAISDDSGDSDNEQNRKKRRERREKERRDKGLRSASSSDSDRERRDRKEKERKKRGGSSPDEDSDDDGGKHHSRSRSGKDGDKKESESKSSLPDSRKGYFKENRKIGVDSSPKGEDRIATIELTDHHQPSASSQPGVYVRPGLDRNTPLWKYVPSGTLQLGYVKRDKAGIFSTRGDIFTFFLEPSRKFVLASRRRAHKNSPNYLISLDATDLSRHGDKFHGKVRANYTATEYVFYDNGVSPDEYAKALARANGSAANLPRVRREIGAAIFEHPNAIGSNTPKTSAVQPRRMIVLLPTFNPLTNEPLVDWCATTVNASTTTPASNATTSMEKKKKKKDDSESEDSDAENNENLKKQAAATSTSAATANATTGNAFSLLIQTYQNHMASRNQSGGATSSLPQYPNDIIILNNKEPQWNEQAKAYQLNFKGRVGQSSIKNFQLVQVSDGGMAEKFNLESSVERSRKSEAEEERRRREEALKKEQVRAKKQADPDRIRAEMSGVVLVKNASDSSDSEDEKERQKRLAKEKEKDKKSKRDKKNRSKSSSDDESDCDGRGKKSSSSSPGAAAASSSQQQQMILIDKFDPEQVVMQFGRRDDKTFSLDFMAPMNAMQALCICLTSFDVKMGME